jgi:hypothetical protein
MPELRNRQEAGAPLDGSDGWTAVEQHRSGSVSADEFVEVVNNGEDVALNVYLDGASGR